MTQRFNFASALCMAALVLTATAVTAETGEALYNEHCATCHAATLRGSAHGAALTGPAFSAKWADRPASALLEYQMREMPPGSSQSLSAGQHAAIAEHVINRAALPKETTLMLTASDLQADGEETSDAVEFSGAGSVMDLARNAGAYNMRSIEGFRTVTTEDLNDPPQGDWLNWRRTLDGHSHSPLMQISAENVTGLGLAWSMAMDRGSNQPTPLGRDGVMFLSHPSNKIQAIDAATGDLIWEYQYVFPPASKMLGGPTRNIALWQDRLFLATYDAAIAAIDARTGQQLWRSQKADYQEAFTHSAGPIVANGIVISGINGCELFTEAGCFITGHDPDTGK